MRELADEAHIDRFMRTLGPAARSEGRVYLTGGATAVLYGWRESTIDVDIKVVPDRGLSERNSSPTARKQSGKWGGLDGIRTRPWRIESTRCAELGSTKR